MNQATILPSEVRERIRIEMERGAVSNCGDVPARSPFAEGMAGVGSLEMADIISTRKISEYGHITDDIVANQPKAPYQPRPIRSAEITCGKCDTKFIYVGRNPKGKRFCDTCLAKTSRKSAKRQDVKRRERRAG